LPQHQRELAGGGRLPRALEAGEEDRRRRARRERELRRPRAHELGELLVDDLHHLLAGRQALCDVLSQRALAHLGHELAGDVEVDVGLEECEPDLPHGAGERLLVERAAAAEVAEGLLELVGERVEHGAARVPGRLGSERAAPPSWRRRPGRTRCYASVALPRDWIAWLSCAEAPP